MELFPEKGNDFLTRAAQQSTRGINVGTCHYNWQERNEGLSTGASVLGWTITFPFQLLIAQWAGWNGVDPEGSAKEKSKYSARTCCREELAALQLTHFEHTEQPYWNKGIFLEKSLEKLVISILLSSKDGSLLSWTQAEMSWAGKAGKERLLGSGTVLPSVCWAGVTAVSSGSRKAEVLRASAMLCSGLCVDVFCVQRSPTYTWRTFSFPVYCEEWKLQFSCCGRMPQLT